MAVSFRAGHPRREGIVGVPIAGYVVPDAFEKNLMVALLGECGLSQERIRLEEERNQIALQTQRESLQANLLRAVSHDLRTPLTNINGSVGILMGKDQTLKPEVREQLYTAIDDDTNWLINMTENLLAATQLESAQDQAENRSRTAGGSVSKCCPAVGPAGKGPPHLS